MTITFQVHGTPKAQPRPRAFARKMGNKFVARVYDAGTAEGWKSLIALAAKEVIPAEPITKPVILNVEFYMPRPKSHYNKSGYNPKYIDIRHAQKPDGENLLKAVQDCLTQLGFWRDDCQVWRHTVEKKWCDPQNAGARIQVVVQ